METQFVKVRSVTDIAVSVLLIASGFILLLLPTDAGINIVGFFLIFTGIILLLSVRSAYKNPLTGEKYKKKEHYFQQDMHPLIASVLATAPDSIDLSKAQKGQTVKLDIYYSRATGKAYLQLFEYIPYKYEPCSDIYEHEVAKVEKLIK